MRLWKCSARLARLIQPRSVQPLQGLISSPLSQAQGLHEWPGRGLRRKAGAAPNPCPIHAQPMQIHVNPCKSMLHTNTTTFKTTEIQTLGEQSKGIDLEGHFASFAFHLSEQLNFFFCKGLSFASVSFLGMGVLPIGAVRLWKCSARLARFIQPRSVQPLQGLKFSFIPGAGPARVAGERTSWKGRRGPRSVPNPCSVHADPCESIQIHALYV